MTMAIIGLKYFKWKDLLRSSDSTSFSLTKFEIFIFLVDMSLPKKKVDLQEIISTCFV